MWQAGCPAACATEGASDEQADGDLGVAAMAKHRHHRHHKHHKHHSHHSHHRHTPAPRFNKQGNGECETGLMIGQGGKQIQIKNAQIDNGGAWALATSAEKSAGHAEFSSDR